MKTLEVVWYLLSKWFRANVDGLIDAVKDEKASRASRLEMRKHIAEQEAVKKYAQDACPHTIPASPSLYSAIVLFGEPVTGRQEHAICQHCQRVWHRPDDTVLFDRITRNYHCFYTPPNPRVVSPEEQRLYDMPLDELKELASA